MQIGDHISKRHHFTSITSTGGSRARQHMSSVPLRLANAMHTRAPGEHDLFLKRTPPVWLAQRGIYGPSMEEEEAGAAEATHPARRVFRNERATRELGRVALAANCRKLLRFCSPSDAHPKPPATQRN